MKRLAAIVLAGVMVFGLAACGGNEDAGNSTEAASGTESDKGTADSGSKDTSGDWDSTNPGKTVPVHVVLLLNCSALKRK